MSIKGMRQNKMKKVNITLGIITITFGLLLIIYNRFVDKYFDNNINIFIIIIFTISLLSLCVYNTIFHFFSKEGADTDNDFVMIVYFVSLIPALPIIIISSIINSKYNVRRRLRFLEEKGFKYKSNCNTYTYQYDNLLIFINQDCSYQISSNYGDNYVEMYECNLGEEFDKYRIKDALIKYQGAHPVDEQRGDVPDTLEFVVIFLKKNIDEILKQKNN